MQSATNFITVFLLWFVGLAAIVYFFLPSIESSRTSMHVYSSANNDTELKKQMDIGDKEYVSFTPLGIFDLLNN